MKRAIVPKLDCIAYFDYVQIEPRVLAYFMSLLGDDSLAQAYRDGEDAYRRVAATVFAKEIEDVTPEERQQAKTVFLGMMYGAGPKKIAATLNVKYAEGKKLWEAFRERIPGLLRVSNPKPKNGWRDDWIPGAIERRLQERGFIVNPYGRRLPPEQWGEYKMLNHLIQSTAADVMRRAMVRVDEALESHDGLEAHLILPVHDELQIDCRERELPWLANAVPALMEDPIISQVVPTPVDMEVTFTTWADKVEWP